MSTETERVYGEITGLIRTGMFAGGKPLRESSIAEMIGTSRTPVREALRRLAAEGTVEYEPNRGATLAQLSESDIEDIFTVRALLESEAARLAALRATPEHVARLEDLYDRMATESDLDAVSVLNTEFHGVILEAAASPIVRDSVGMVTKRSIVRQTFGLYSPEQHKRSQQQHRDLVDAIRTGNVRWAHATMMAHIESGREAHERHN